MKILYLTFIIIFTACNPFAEDDPVLNFNEIVNYKLPLYQYYNGNNIDILDSIANVPSLTFKNKNYEMTFLIIENNAYKKYTENGEYTYSDEVIVETTPFGQLSTFKSIEGNITFYPSSGTRWNTTFIKTHNSFTLKLEPISIDSPEYQYYR